jgi:hypothetical protein
LPLVGDDPGVARRDQKDVWRLAKFSSLSSTVTRGGQPTFKYL